MQPEAYRQCAHGSLRVEVASKKDAAWRRFLRAIADVGLKQGIQTLHLCMTALLHLLSKRYPKHSNYQNPFLRKLPKFQRCWLSDPCVQIPTSLLTASCNKETRGKDSYCKIKIWSNTKCILSEYINAQNKAFNSTRCHAQPDIT